MGEPTIRLHKRLTVCWLRLSVNNSSTTSESGNFLKTVMSQTKRRWHKSDAGITATLPGEVCVEKKPEAPPPPLPPFSLPPLPMSFGGLETVGALAEPAHSDYQGLSGIDPTEQFYVRTLTANDVNKLHGRTPGTAEWDIGVTARKCANRLFWGWPGRYANVVRTLPRLEWRMTGSLRSSLTGDAGVDVEISIWFREERPGHAAEHRLRIGPRATLTNATPSNFDTTSLVVLERLPLGRTNAFFVQLLTTQDPGYADYYRYLTQERPRHRYGYGP